MTKSVTEKIVNNYNISDEELRKCMIIRQILLLRERTDTTCLKVAEMLMAANNISEDDVKMYRL